MRLIRRRSVRLLLMVCWLFTGPAGAQDRELDVPPSSLEHWNALKYGMFIHWGDYSALGGIYHGKKIPRLGEQIQRHAKAPNPEYEMTVKDFNPVDFDADEWVSVAKNAGMKYMVITVKHHNGFCMWDTETTDYDIVDATPYKRDPIKELADACKREGLGFGIYYSTIDWHFPGSVKREVPGQFSVYETITDEHHQYSLAQLKELCSGRYGNLVQVFFDMGRPTHQQSKDYRSLVKSMLPECQINGRIMNNMGDFLTMPDNAVPRAPIPQAWEAPSTLYHWSKNEIPEWSNEWWNTWGYKSWIPTPPLEMQVEKQLRKMAVIVSRGGNFLLNVGPDGWGRIIPYEKRVLQVMSHWLKRNGQAIYGTRPTPFTRNPELICTRKPGRLYFFLTQDLKENMLVLPGFKSEIIRAYLLTDSARTSLSIIHDTESSIILPEQKYDPWMDVLVVEYEGELKIESPVISQYGDRSVILSYDEAYITGSYDSESYRSLANDTHCNWDIEVDKSGMYTVQVDLKSKLASTNYILQVNESRFPIQVVDHQFRDVAGTMRLKKSGRIKVSVYPAESKRILSNGYAGFNSLMLEDVTVKILPD